MLSQDAVLNPCCPNCEGDTRLQFYPMHDGEVLAVCPCGRCWEHTPKEAVN